MVMKVVSIDARTGSMKYLTYREGETACDILRRVMKMRTKDKAAGKSTSYCIREFSEAESTDTRGELVPTRTVKFNRGDIDTLIKEYEANGLESYSFQAWSQSIETGIGAPAISMPIKYSCKHIEMLPLAEIGEKLVKYRKRAQQEIKRAKDMTDLEEPQNPRTIGGLEILNWLFNDGVSRTADDVVKKLFSIIVLRERERLFYIQRHPSQPSLHVCLDNEINEQIKLLRWSIKNYKVFRRMYRYGQAKA